MKIKLINEAFDKQYGVKEERKEKITRSRAHKMNEATVEDFYEYQEEHDDYHPDIYAYTDALYDEADRQGLENFVFEVSGQAGDYTDEIMFDRDGTTMAYYIDTDKVYDVIADLGPEKAAKRIIAKATEDAKPYDDDEDDEYTDAKPEFPQNDFFYPSINTLHFDGNHNDDKLIKTIIDSIYNTFGVKPHYIDYSTDSIKLFYEVARKFLTARENEAIPSFSLYGRNHELNDVVSEKVNKLLSTLPIPKNSIKEVWVDRAEDLSIYVYRDLTNRTSEDDFDEGLTDTIANIAGGGLATGLAKKKIGGMFEDLGKDVDKYQEWIDYDMKRYGKISAKTNREIRKAGLRIVKDKYGDYEVIA